MTGIDWLILGLYFAFVLGIGVALKGSVKTSTDFFLAGRAIPAWVCGLAFMSANLGAQEVIGMGASGAKYGIATSHFYWIGAIPAMVFVGIFMMPFYYGSRARSVPEYLRLRFDEKTRGLNAVSFAIMTIFSSGISMYAIAKLIQTLHVFDGEFQRLGINSSWIFDFAILISAIVVLVYTFLGGLSSSHAGTELYALVGRDESRQYQSPRCGMVRPSDGPGLRALLWLLVHGFSRRAARHGSEIHERGKAHSTHRRIPKNVVSVSGHPARLDCHRVAHAA